MHEAENYEEDVLIFNGKFTFLTEVSDKFLSS